MLMDDIDRKILKLLQENARMSLKTLQKKPFCHLRLFLQGSKNWKKTG